MLYLYDNAICDDLRRSFNSIGDSVPLVKVIDPEGAVTIAAQMQNDEITYPIVILSRDPSPKLDTQRYNFTRAKKGVVVGFDKDTNQLLTEKAIPINLTYRLTVITTTTADMDELMKELIFKYTDMYFLPIQLPYESKRMIRFGIQIMQGADIESKSGSFEYISGGKLYESHIPLECHGCVLLSYTTQHIRRFDLNTKIAEDLK